MAEENVATLSVLMSISSSHLISLMVENNEWMVIPWSLTSAYCTIYRARSKRKIEPRDTSVKKHIETTQESLSVIPNMKESNSGTSEKHHRNQTENKTLPELTFILIFPICMYK